MTGETFSEFVGRRFGGVLTEGKHEPDGHACVLEAYSQYLRKDWSDAPHYLPDIRSLNDSRWPSDEDRTRAMLSVVAAYQDWPSMPLTRRQAIADRLVILTMQRIVADLPYLPDDIRRRCRRVKTIKAAQMVAKAAVRAGAVMAPSWADLAAKSAVEAAAPAPTWAAHRLRAVVEIAKGASWSPEARTTVEIAERMAAQEAREAVVARSGRAASVARAAAEAAATAARVSEDGSAATEAMQRRVSLKVLNSACALWIEAAREGADAT